MLFLPPPQKRVTLEDILKDQCRFCAQAERLTNIEHTASVSCTCDCHFKKSQP